MSYKVKRIVDLINPRYIFSANIDLYFSRLPYLNRKKYLTRFISLADVSKDISPDKKFIYALKICPINQMSSTELYDKECNFTENPFESQDETQLSNLVSGFS